MKRVMIVDDEQIVLDVLQRILSRLGYNPVVTDSWEVALQKFSNEDFDLVLMDILMPEKDGFEVAREMRKIRPEQKIVLVTGIGADTAAAQADSEKVGVEYILTKPFSYERVKTVVANTLGGENQFVEERITSF